MKTITLTPLQGMEIEGLGALRFGQNLQDVVALLGKPDSGETERLYYHGLGLRVDLDRAGGVEFMEFFRPENDDYQLSLYGIDPLALPASGFINFNQRLLSAVPKNFSAVAFGCGLSLWKWFQILPAILFGGRSS